MSGHEAHTSHKKLYIWIFVVLAVLTVLELFVPDLPMSTFKKGSALTALAIVKAFCVAYWYMHLNEEKAWLKFIAAIPISAAAYATIVILESLYR